MSASSSISTIKCKPKVIRPLGDRILVREESEHGWHTEEHTNGILLQRREANGICFGRVVALGPRVSPSLELKVGDKVHFLSGCGNDDLGDGLLLFRQSQNLLELVGEGKVARV